MRLQIVEKRWGNHGNGSWGRGWGHKLDHCDLTLGLDVGFAERRRGVSHQHGSGRECAIKVCAHQETEAAIGLGSRDGVDLKAGMNHGAPLRPNNLITSIADRHKAP